MNCKIMLVDDDLQFRKTVRRSLEMNEYNVIEAANGNEAIDILMMEEVDLVLSDVKMPKLNGIELLHRIKRDRPNTPFIMMTGFSEIIEIKEAYEIGADGFLSKPYNESDLVFQIQKVLNTLEKEDKKATKYISVPIEEFVAGAQIKYPIFIQLEDESFVKVANQGEDLNSAQIKTFKDKGVNDLYLTVNDFLQYLDFNLAILNSLTRSEKISSGKKLKFFKILIHHAIQYIKVDGISEDIISRLAKIKDNMTRFFDRCEKDILFHLDETFSPNEEKDDFTAISVCLLMYMVKKIEWISEGSKEEIFLASVLQNMLESDSKDKEHPYLAYAALEKNELISKEIAEMILHHHEVVDGSGFPSGLNASQISPLGNLIGLSYSLAVCLKKSKFDFTLTLGHFLSKEASLFKKEFIQLLVDIKQDLMLSA